ncbi:MAG TPA: hypothetical protein VF828_04380 [Patescibacteria group bacterium]
MTFSKLSKIITFMIPAIVIIVLALSLRGLVGNPGPLQLNSPVWIDNGPFELSPERGRYALLYSLIENHSFHFPVDIARFATPDLGYANGYFVSLFAPAVSLTVAPGYLLGRFFGAAQVGTFAVIALFAFLNFLLIQKISIRLGARPLPAMIAALIFLFATPAFNYSVSLYQHHISTFLLLSCVLILLQGKGIRNFIAIWFLIFLSVSVDYPNAFMMLPVALATLPMVISARTTASRLNLTIFPRFILGFFAALILPLILFMWTNYQSYGKYLQLAGTVASVYDIDQNGRPSPPKNSTEIKNLQKYTRPDTQHKSLIRFFKTRNLLNGFYILTVSPDRGILTYAPLMLFGILGIILAYRRRLPYLELILGIILADFLLYSMWGDPWGGWAFGSRYLIPGFAFMSVLIALLLTWSKWKVLLILIITPIFVYSALVNTAGALTTNAMPPQIEVLNLEKISGEIQPYTYIRNFTILAKNQSKSFAYQTFFQHNLTAFQYFWLVFSCISLPSLAIFIIYAVTKNES